ncbi:unnamed protein product [Cladocopium goreaui]|uniref:Exoglucanase-6A n=1 Tax=Cladocopium goreaui TaxID=2562237 RepID=A0A9P1G7K7_9DINO|nr:unnamed protein product [Cladocopium goreaui]
MARQYFFQLEMASPSMLGRSGPDFFEQNTQTVEETYELRGEKTFYAKWLAQIMLYVTAGHEQAGAVEVYAQDVSWTAFRWTKGQKCGTKQAATATALLMSFTNLPMPRRGRVVVFGELSREKLRPENPYFHGLYHLSTW